MCTAAAFTAVGMQASTAAAAATAVQVATTVATIAQQQQQQKIQVKNIENQAEAATQQYNFAQKNLENEAISQKDAAENELFNANVEAARARGSALAQGAASGTTGGTTQALGNSLDAEIGRQINDINRNFDIYKQSAQSQSDANYRSLSSTLTGLDQPVGESKGLTSALQVVGTGLTAYQESTDYFDDLSKGYVKGEK